MTYFPMFGLESSVYTKYAHLRPHLQGNMRLSPRDFPPEKPQLVQNLPVLVADCNLLQQIRPVLAASSSEPSAAATAGSPHGYRPAAPPESPPPETPPAACSADNPATHPPHTSTAEAHPPPPTSSADILRPKALKPRRVRIPQRPRQQPHHSIHDHRRRQLAAREHIVPNRNLAVAKQLIHPLIHALIPPAEDDHPLHRRQLLRHRLRKRPPLRRQQNHRLLLRIALSLRRNLQRSTASKIGSAFSTMPSPPPNGRSSTVRWRSCVKLRRSCAATSTSPAYERASECRSRADYRRSPERS